MKTEKVDVKSKGDILGTVEVPVFGDIKEAIGRLKADRVLSLINRQHKSDLANEFRAGQTRAASPISQLNRLAKSNPEVEKQVQALLKKYGVEMPKTV